MQHTGLTDFTFALDFLFSRHVHIYIFRSSCVLLLPLLYTLPACACFAVVRYGIQHSISYSVFYRFHMLAHGFCLWIFRVGFVRYVCYPSQRAFTDAAYIHFGIFEPIGTVGSVDGIVVVVCIIMYGLAIAGWYDVRWYEYYVASNNVFQGRLQCLYST